MEDKIEREFRRQELADFLENLARQVRSGSFQVQGTQREVPERLETKIELKEKKGRVIAKVRFRWAVLAEYDDKTRAEMVRRQEDFKALKNQLAEMFSDLLNSAELGLFPAESKMMQFVALSKEFSGLADPDWESEMQEYLDHVDNLYLSWKNKQLEMFHHELRDLKVRVKACHQEYG
jgi:XXXCH domain-containing protein